MLIINLAQEKHEKLRTYVYEVTVLICVPDKMKSSKCKNNTRYLCVRLEI